MKHNEKKILSKGKILALLICAMMLSTATVVMTASAYSTTISGTGVATIGEIYTTEGEYVTYYGSYSSDGSDIVVNDNGSDNNNVVEEDDTSSEESE